MPPIAFRRKVWRWVCWYSWVLWNRTRYYWPQAQTRKRTGARLEAEYAKHGIDWHPPKAWWIPW